MLQTTGSTSALNTGSNASTGGSGSGANPGSANMGKQEFLQLLVTQLRNQNPRSPMKGREFASQLAQFSSVEQLTNISGQIKQQQSGNAALQRSVISGMATDLIGRTVEANGNQFTWDGEGQRTLGMDLYAPASEVTVTIRDSAGNAVHKRTLENVDAGPTEVTWDGRTTDGSRLPTGTYNFQVEATDGQGGAIRSTSYVQGTVDRVSFNENGTSLWVDGTQISMDRLRSVDAS